MRIPAKKTKQPEAITTFTDRKDEFVSLPTTVYGKSLICLLLPILFD